TGTAGATGATGTTGATGATGPTGAAGSAGQFFRNQNLSAVTPGGIIPLTTSGADNTPGAFTLNGDGTVTINIPGLYFVQGKTDVFNLIGTYSTALALNGAILPESITTFVSTEANTKFLINDSIVFLVTGNVISLVNNPNSGTTFSLSANSAATCSIVLVRIA
ncbi:hypothetical protein FC694_25975, partial [Bacillus wiedmannii]